jgi:hypothetical protein
MSGRDPKIVFLGTKRKDGSDDNLFDMMKHINANCIPVDLLYGLYLTNDEHETMRIDTSNFKGDIIAFDLIVKYLEKRKLYDSAVSIEVVLDTEKTCKYLEGLSGELLHTIFNNNNI